MVWIHTSEDAGRLRLLMAEDSERVCRGVEINAGMGVARASVIRHEGVCVFCGNKGTWDMVVGCCVVGDGQFLVAV